MKSSSEKEFETFFTADIEAALTSCFEAGGTLTVFPKGTSMLPSIVQGKDSVELSRVKKIAENEIYLYKRPNGAFALHRLLKAEGEKLIFRGDAQLVSETVKKEQLIAFVCGIYREGKRKDVKTSYKFFLFANSFYFFRKAVIKLRSLKKRMKRWF